jgi:hypothetical protein
LIAFIFRRNCSTPYTRRHITNEIPEPLAINAGAFFRASLAPSRPSCGYALEACPLPAATMAASTQACSWLPTPPIVQDVREPVDRRPRLSGSCCRDRCSRRASCVFHRLWRRPPCVIYASCEFHTKVALRNAPHSSCAAISQPSAAPLAEGSFLSLLFGGQIYQLLKRCDESRSPDQGQGVSRESSRMSATG